MTEDEAKTKWCPHALSPIVLSVAPGRGFSAAVATNRTVSEAALKVGLTAEAIPEACLCVASACMAWRALTRTEMRHRDGHVVKPGEIYLRGNATAHQVSDGGYCGLAGAPQ